MLHQPGDRLLREVAVDSLAGPVTAQPRLFL